MTGIICPCCNRVHSTIGEKSENYVLSPKQQSLFIDGKSVYFRRSLFGIFVRLAKSAPRVVSKDGLFQAIIRNSTGEEANGIGVVTVDISHIRKKLFGTSFDGLVKTKWGEGFYLHTDRKPVILEEEIDDGDEDEQHPRV